MPLSKKRLAARKNAAVAKLKRELGNKYNSIIHDPGHGLTKFVFRTEQ